MDLDKVSVNRIPLSVRPRKFKRPIVTLLNEYLHDDVLDFDVFEKRVDGTWVTVDLPEDLNELYVRLEDMVRVAQIATEKYEIARDALRLAVHLFYRIILLENRFDYHDFILYYEQFNEAWTEFSREYHSKYEEWHRFMTSKEESNIKKYVDIEDWLDFKNLSTSDNNTAENEDVGKRHSIEGSQDTTIYGEGSSLASEKSSYPRIKDREMSKKHNAREQSGLSNLGVNQKCFYINEQGFLHECPHSKFVLYQLYRTGDFLMATGDKCEEHRDCDCYNMKCNVIREIHPCFRDIAWGHKIHCFYRYWCFINCLITTESVDMLKAIHPFMININEGLLVPCQLSDSKRLTLRTAALKYLIYNY